VSRARLQLSISSELSQVRFLGAAVRALLAELCCSEERIGAVELCLVEAVNNVIEHAYREEPGHPVGVELLAEGARLTVALADEGTPMPEGTLERAREARARQQREELAAASAAPGDGEAADPAEPALGLEAIAEGGYGLGLILELMEQVTYRRDGGRNILTMTVGLGEDAAAAPPAAGFSTAPPTASTGAAYLTK
jgi:serine/threonine-protein kinase RsbW